MAELELVKALEREERKLEQELEQVPTFKRLKAVQQTLSVYRGDVAPDAAPKAAERAPKGAERSQTEVIAKAVEEHLRRERKRITSGPLTKAVEAQGIHVPGKVPSARLAAILAARSKTFDNVKGEGYGLVEWGGGSPSQGPQRQETPDSSPLSGAPGPNGNLPYGH